MSKALVIKSADFSTNKLTTVNLSNAVPCTGITLDKSTISATSFADQTNTPTVSPLDCTEPVTWSTSDSAVATVSGGVVTPQGLGIATITATCGSYSATCVVTVDNIVVSTGWKWGGLYSPTSWESVNAYYPSNYKSLVWCDVIPLISDRLHYSHTNEVVGDVNLAPTMIPAGVGRIRLEATDVSGQYNIIFSNSTTATSGEIIRKLGQSLEWAPTNGRVDATTAVTDGTDCIGITFSLKTQHTSDEDAETVASTLGCRITFMLPAAEEEEEEEAN